METSWKMHVAYRAYAAGACFFSDRREKGATKLNAELRLTSDPPPFATSASSEWMAAAVAVAAEFFGE